MTKGGLSFLCFLLASPFCSFQAVFLGQSPIQFYTIFFHMASAFAVLARKFWVQGAIKPWNMLWGSGLPQVRLASITIHAIGVILSLVAPINIQTTSHSLGNGVD